MCFTVPESAAYSSSFLKFTWLRLNPAELHLHNFTLLKSSRTWTRPCILYRQHINYLWLFWPPSCRWLSSVLLLLDLTAAFDTVDDYVLVHRLNTLSMWGGGLWFCFKLVLFLFLQQIFINNSSSSCGVPQASILGPFFFSTYFYSSS